MDNCTFWLPCVQQYPVNLIPQSAVNRVKIYLQLKIKLALLKLYHKRKMETINPITFIHIAEEKEQKF